MPLIAAGVGAAGSVIGGIFGGKQAKKAANAQTQQDQKALDLQKQMYDQTRSDLAPWREAGGAAIGQGYAMLQPGYDYTASPGYQFRLDEGNRAIQNSGAAKGMLMSGGTLKDIDRFSQGLAASDFNDQFNREMAVAAGGMQANQTGANAASNYANAGSQIYGNIGNAKASGYAGVNQAFQGTLSNLANIGGMYGNGGFAGFGG
jgi:hypothetical protein